MTPINIFARFMTCVIFASLSPVLSIPVAQGASPVVPSISDQILMLYADPHEADMDAEIDKVKSHLPKISSAPCHGSIQRHEWGWLFANDRSLPPKRDLDHLSPDCQYAEDLSPSPSASKSVFTPSPTKSSLPSSHSKSSSPSSTSITSVYVSIPTTSVSKSASKTHKDDDCEDDGAAPEKVKNRPGDGKS